jgi:diguanylate cyclase (GGDEF)-like protein
LIDTDHESGVAVAERIRATVAGFRFEDGRGAPIHLEISIGVATYPAHGEERDGLLDAADKAMYLAKSQGRNCVCSAAALRR